MFRKSSEGAVEGAELLSASLTKSTLMSTPPRRDSSMRASPKVFDVPMEDFKPKAEAL